jgi:small-conductance mechanosensitive channel
MDFAEVARLVGQVIKYPLFTLQGQSITLMDVLTFTLFVVATLVLSSLLRKGADRALTKRGVDDLGTHTIARRLIHFGVLTLGLTTAVTNLGFNLSAILAAGAVLGVGIGFALQSVAQNFISGLLLLFERSIKPGDILEVEGRVVRVEDLRIRATVVRTRFDERIIIPNSTLAQGAVTNFTMVDSVYRIKLDVGVSYESDMHRVRAALERAAGGVPWRLGDREPQILMTGFRDSSVNFEVSVWIDDPWAARRRVSDLHEAVWWTLREDHIVIAFPQVDVHFDTALHERLDRMPRAS